jgi:hypothetical protein
MRRIRGRCDDLHLPNDGVEAARRHAYIPRGPRVTDPPPPYPATMLRRLPTLLLLACGACSGDPAPDDLARIPAPASALRPTDAAASASPEAYLVWSIDPADTVGVGQTAWIDGEGRVVARRPGVYVAGGGAVWAWTKGTKPARGGDCDCLEENDFAEDAQCPKTAPVGVADLVDALGGRRIALLEVPTSNEQIDYSQMEPPEQDAWPVGGVGPYLLMERSIYMYGCGAHGSVSVEWSVYDLRTGDTVALLDNAEVEAATAREGAAALAELRKEMTEDEAAVREVEMTAVETRWTAEGALRVGYQFTTGACYACSDGIWSSYSRSLVVPAPTLPRPLAPYARAPEAVRRYWASSPPGERAGWSEVDAPDVAAALARFRAP